MAEPPPPPPTALRRSAGAAPPAAVEPARSDAPPPIEELIGLGRDEEAALKDGARRWDLRVRVILLAWDGLGQTQGAASLLEKVEHPTAPALRLHLALDAGDAAALNTLTEDALRRRDTVELLALGDVWLLRVGDVTRAATAYTAAGPNGRTELAVALAHAGRWQELLALWSSSTRTEDRIAAAQIAQDHLDDAATARNLLAQAFATAETRTPYLVERHLELGIERLTALRLKLELLGAPHGPLTERAATQYQLAEALEAEGNAEAADLYGLLCEGEAHFGQMLALRARARVQAARGDWTDAASAWSELASKIAEPRWAAAAWRRAAELWDSRVGDVVEAEQIYQKLHGEEPREPAILHALVRLAYARKDLARAATLLAEHVTTDAARQVRVARMLEAVGDPQAVEKWRELAVAPNADRPLLEALARASRRAAERAELVQLYRRLSSVVEPRAAAAYQLAAGALALAQGQGDVAQTAIAAALEADPRDLLAHAARALVLRAANRPADYVAALQSALALATSPAARARLLREIARVSAQDLGDRQAAEAHYARALQLEPDNPTTLHAFARLAGDLGNWNRAVELREQAVKHSTGARAAELLCQIGEIYAARLNDDVRARSAFDRAVAADPDSREALSQLAALHRRHNRRAELLDVLQRLVTLAPTPTEQLAVHLEIAQVAEQDIPPAELIEAPPQRPRSVRDTAEIPVAALRAGGELAFADHAAVALEAYRAALAIDAGNALALLGFERLCRREGRWDELAQALEQAPQTRSQPRAVALLAEAYEQLERWGRLAEVLELEVSLLEQSDRKEAAQVARSLARLYEERLGDVDAAARAWHHVDEADPDDLEAPRALQRIYESRGRYADLAAAIERELSRLQLARAEVMRGGAVSDEVRQLHESRQLELWLRLGEIRRLRLARPDQAAEAYDQVLQLDPTQTEALSALVDLYTTLGRSRDVERILDLRAAVMTDPKERSLVLTQKGELLERNADDEGALAAYQEAFALDPANRQLFTTLERVCYRREKWQAAMDLYDKAIHLVEVKRLRAYRLADLYLRRGQVQLQFLGQPGEAAASYLRVVELDPEADTAQAALERLFSAQADWAGLIHVYERRAELVRDDPKRVEILRRAARVALAKLRDPQQAARLYSRIHAVDPTDAEALDALERHYERVREWEKLVEVLKTRIVLTTGGDEAIALYLRIANLCEEHLRDLDKSIEAYRKILDVAPSHREALDALGRLYEGTEQWAELIEITRRQVRIITDRSQKAILYFKCGSVMESKFGKDDDAIRYYDAAIKTSPACLPAVHGLRDLYLRREDWAKVIETLTLESKLWSEDKERAGVFAHIGSIYGEKLHDEERAIQYYESALGVDKECLPANRALFNIYFARGDYPRARPLGEVLGQKVMREGDPATRSEFYRKSAIVAQETGDSTLAARTLEMALEYRPDDLDALDLLVNLCRGAPDAHDYIDTFRELEKVYRKRDEGRALARVLVAQGALREREYDIDAAEEHYNEALKLAPDDFPVVDALVGLHYRLRRFEAGVQVLQQFTERVRHIPSRTLARLRLAELLGDGAMDARRAAASLEALIAEDPNHRGAHFLLAQQLYLLGRYPEAQRVCERLINLAAAPGHTAPPEELARYYDYLGRIAEAVNDGASAQRSYRRAVDLNPAFPPPLLSLARRAAAVGDTHQVGALLDEAIRNATAKGEAAMRELRRGMARFYASLGDQRRAIALYHETLAFGQPDNQTNDDRVALAELCAREPDGYAAARAELAQVIASDIRAPQAYRLLMQIYERSGETDRAARVASTLRLLGYADPEDRPPPPTLSPARRNAISDELRRTLLLPPAATGIFTEVLQALREPLETIFLVPPVGTLGPVGDPTLRGCINEVARLFDVEPDVALGNGIPGGALALELPKQVVVIDAALAERPDAERRFLLGRALEPIRGGYTLPLRLRPAERVELGRILDQALHPDRREPGTQELVGKLPRKASRALERLVAVAQAQPIPAGAYEQWLQALTDGSERAGLLACDDAAAAARMLARLGGEELAVTSEGGVALGQLPGGAGLIRFYLSDAFHSLKQALR